MTRIRRHKRRMFPLIFISVILFLVSTVFMTACMDDFNSTDNHSDLDNPSIEDDLSNTDVGIKTDNYIPQNVFDETPDTENIVEDALSGITIYSVTVHPSSIRVETSIDFSKNDLLNPNDDTFDFSFYLRIHIESDLDQFDGLRTISSHFTPDGETISGSFDIGVMGVETSDDGSYRGGNIDFGTLGSFVLVFSGYDNNEVRIPLTI